jgi:hypothetical protein
VAEEYVRVLGQPLAAQQVGQVLASLPLPLVVVVVLLLMVLLLLLLQHERVQGCGLAEPVAVGGNFSCLAGTILLSNLFP